MPVLSFPCVIHRVIDSRPTRRRVWIKGHDLRTLALAATARLGAEESQCRYRIVVPESIKASVFLEVDHREGDALVGPTAGPLPPPTMPVDEVFSLDALIVVLGLVPSQGADQAGRYHVVVTYSPIRARDPYPPVRAERETDTQYQERRRLAERVGFEPTCRLPDKPLSRRPRYDHFGTSPVGWSGRFSRAGFYDRASVDRRAWKKRWRISRLSSPSTPAITSTWWFSVGWFRAHMADATAPALGSGVP
jgi:hypothetical protein